MLLLRMLCLLMLMFLLRDADSVCPIEPNPLSVQPAVAVEEYGGQLHVNCTSDNEEYEDTIWKVGKDGALTEDEKKLPSLDLSLTDWNMNVECMIKINDTHECSQDVDLTIYKNPEVVLSIIDVQALGEETLYELQCDVLNVAPVQYLTVRWYTNNELNKTDSFNDTTRTPVNESRTLSLTVRREDNVVEVRCEAQLDFRQNESLPTVSETHNVSAHYAPELKIKNDTEDVYALEGTDISLNCEAEGNPPPVFHWTSDELNVPVDTDILNITQENAGSVYICTATNYLGNKTKHFHIHGTNKKIEATSASAPIPKAAATGCPVTLTPSEIVVRFGDPVSVNCSASDVDGLGWESTVGGTGLEIVTFRTWTVEKLENWNENASCYASVDDIQCQKYVDITVYQTPDTVSIRDGGPMLEGTQYQLQCGINNVAPVQKLKVKWYRGGEILFEDTFSDTTLTPVSVTSNLTISPTKEDNGALFRCHAELHLGPNGPEFLPNTTSEPYAAVVYYKPIINSCALHHSVVEHEYSLDMLACDADGNPPPTIKWYYEDKEVMNSSALLSRTDSGNYRAEFENRMGRNSVQVDITVEYGPSFTCNESYDVEVNGKLQCEPEGIPTPRLTWFKDGKEIVPPQSWTKQDSGEYLIKASNKHGEASHMLYVNILYAPELKIKNDTEDIYALEGTDISLNCEAEGNPPPVFHWTGDELNVPVDTDILNITQVNAGSVYICTATNYLGNKTKHFHIHGTNKKIEATSTSAPIPKAAETGCPVTLTPPEIVVRFGDPVSVNCSASDVDGLGWESTVGGTDLERVTFLAWTVEILEAWDIKSSCYASLDDRQCQKYLNITVYQTPDTVSIRDGGPMLEGTQYQLQCSINNVAPVQKLKVKWYRAGEILSEDTFSDTTLTPISVTSNLTISPTKEDNGALFRCQAELHLGPSGPEFLPNTTSEPYAAVVYYKPIIKDCPGHHSVVERKFSLDMLACNADGNPPPTIKWYYKDKEVMDSSALLSRTDSGNYRAEFENRMGRNSVQVDITVEYGPSFTCNESYDVEVNGKLQCEPEGIPTPRLTWFKDGKEIVPPQSWTKEDRGEYLIKASNKHGEATHRLYVNILYPPEFKEVQGDHVMEFIQGENVTLNCSAEGNPPPEIQWSHTSTGNSEPTVWRQNTITITGATSTSSGVYICVATNKFGNVTRSVTLMMKGTPDFPYPFLLVLIIAGIIILTIVAVVIYRNRKKKRGLYSFVSKEDVLMTSVGNNDIKINDATNGGVIYFNDDQSN